VSPRRTLAYPIHGFRLNQPDSGEEAQLIEAVTRGRAYLAAGADCVFVAGCTTPEAIRTLVAEFGPGRLSLLALPGIGDPRSLQALDE
jgi:2-methylisocitrate lyase-like PEP mutase family enzyme